MKTILLTLKIIKPVKAFNTTQCLALNPETTEHSPFRRAFISQFGFMTVNCRERHFLTLKKVYKLCLSSNQKQITKMQRDTEQQKSK